MTTSGYPLDLTGTAVTNKITQEKIILRPGVGRLCTTAAGAFYVDSLVITDLATGQPLTVNTDYWAVELIEVPTVLSGKFVAQCIFINSATVSANIQIDYQALGGDYAESERGRIVVDQFYGYGMDSWPNEVVILMQPVTQYPVEVQRHNQYFVDKKYTFENIEHAIDRIRVSFGQGAEPHHSAIKEWKDAKFADITKRVMDLKKALEDHLGYSISIDRDPNNGIIVGNFIYYGQGVVTPLFLNKNTIKTVGQPVVDLLEMWNSSADPTYNQTRISMTNNNYAKSWLLFKNVDGPATMGAEYGYLSSATVVGIDSQSYSQYTYSVPMALRAKMNQSTNFTMTYPRSTVMGVVQGATTTYVAGSTASLANSFTATVLSPFTHYVQYPNSTEISYDADRPHDVQMTSGHGRVSTDSVYWTDGILTLVKFRTTNHTAGVQLMFFDVPELASISAIVFNGTRYPWANIAGGVTPSTGIDLKTGIATKTYDLTNFLPLTLESLYLGTYANGFSIEYSDSALKPVVAPTIKLEGMYSAVTGSTDTGVHIKLSGDPTTLNMLTMLGGHYGLNRCLASSQQGTWVVNRNQMTVTGTGSFREYDSGTLKWADLAIDRTKSDLADPAKQEGTQASVFVHTNQHVMWDTTHLGESSAYLSFGQFVDIGQTENASYMRGNPCQFTDGQIGIVAMGIIGTRDGSGGFSQITYYLQLLNNDAATGWTSIKIGNDVFMYSDFAQLPGIFTDASNRQIVVFKYTGPGKPNSVLHHSSALGLVPVSVTYVNRPIKHRVEPVDFPNAPDTYGWGDVTSDADHSAITLDYGKIVYLRECYDGTTYVKTVIDILVDAAGSYPYKVDLAHKWRGMAISAGTGAGGVSAISPLCPFQPTTGWTVSTIGNRVRYVHQGATPIFKDVSSGSVGIRSYTNANSIAVGFDTPGVMAMSAPTGNSGKTLQLGSATNSYAMSSLGYIDPWSPIGYLTYDEVADSLELGIVSATYQECYSGFSINGSWLPIDKFTNLGISNIGSVMTNTYGGGSFTNALKLTMSNVSSVALNAFKTAGYPINTLVTQTPVTVDYKPLSAFGGLDLSGNGNIGYQQSLLPPGVTLAAQGLKNNTAIWDCYVTYQTFVPKTLTFVLSTPLNAGLDVSSLIIGGVAVDLNSGVNSVVKTTSADGTKTMWTYTKTTGIGSISVPVGKLIKVVVGVLKPWILADLWQNSPASLQQWGVTDPSPYVSPVPQADRTGMGFYDFPANVGYWPKALIKYSNPGNGNTEWASIRGILSSYYGPTQGGPGAPANWYDQLTIRLYTSYPAPFESITFTDSASAATFTFNHREFRAVQRSAPYYEQIMVTAVPTDVSKLADLQTRINGLSQLFKNSSKVYVAATPATTISPTNYIMAMANENAITGFPMAGKAVGKWYLGYRANKFGGIHQDNSQPVISGLYQGFTDSWVGNTPVCTPNELVMMVPSAPNPNVFNYLALGTAKLWLEDATVTGPDGSGNLYYTWPNAAGNVYLQNTEVNYFATGYGSNKFITGTITPGAVTTPAGIKLTGFSDMDSIGSVSTPNPVIQTLPFTLSAIYCNQPGTVDAQEPGWMTVGLGPSGGNTTRKLMALVKSITFPDLSPIPIVFKPLNPSTAANVNVMSTYTPSTSHLHFEMIDVNVANVYAYLKANVGKAVPFVLEYDFTFNQRNLFVGLDGGQRRRWASGVDSPITLSAGASNNAMSYCTHALQDGIYVYGSQTDVRTVVVEQTISNPATVGPSSAGPLSMTFNSGKVPNFDGIIIYPGVGKEPGTGMTLMKADAVTTNPPGKTVYTWNSTAGTLLLRAGEYVEWDWIAPGMCQTHSYYDNGIVTAIGFGYPNIKRGGGVFDLTGNVKPDFLNGGDCLKTEVATVYMLREYWRGTSFAGSTMLISPANECYGGVNVVQKYLATGSKNISLNSLAVRVPISKRIVVGKDEFSITQQANAWVYSSVTSGNSPWAINPAVTATQGLQYFSNQRLDLTFKIPGYIRFSPVDPNIAGTRLGPLAGDPNAVGYGYNPFQYVFGYVKFNFLDTFSQSFNSTFEIFQDDTTGKPQWTSIKVTDPKDSNTWARYDRAGVGTYRIDSSYVWPEGVSNQQYMYWAGPTATSGAVNGNFTNRYMQVEVIMPKTTLRSIPSGPNTYIGFGSVLEPQYNLSANGYVHGCWAQYDGSGNMIDFMIGLDSTFATGWGSLYCKSITVTPRDGVPYTIQASSLTYAGSTRYPGATGAAHIYYVTGNLPITLVGGSTVDFTFNY